MANYHSEVEMISRGKGRSISAVFSYILGKKIHDQYLGKTYRTNRKDVVATKVYLPENAPPEFADPQRLCDEINLAERRWDAQTGRQFINSLPNELPPGEWIRIVREFVENNFTSQNLCAVAAIHRGRNLANPSKNNPHVHIIVSTRTLGPDGFSKKKDREHNKKQYLIQWREQWAEIQNRAYERNQLDIRISHESLAVQGKLDREPTIHLSHMDWQKEQRGERTAAGNRKRKIQERNRQREKVPKQEISLDRSR